MAIFLDQNHGLTPLKNVNFSTFWTIYLYSLERGFFVVEYRKKHFPGLYCLKKKKLEKRPFWDQNHGLTLWKNVNFWLFELFVFIA